MAKFYRSRQWQFMIVKQGFGDDVSKVCLRFLPTIVKRNICSCVSNVRSWVILAPSTLLDSQLQLPVGKNRKTVNENVYYRHETF